MPLNLQNSQSGMFGTTTSPYWLPNRPQPACDRYEASTWVQLLDLPNPYSSDEALLLCEQSADEWVAWVPDHGEVVLHTSQFCSVG